MRGRLGGPRSSGERLPADIVVCGIGVEPCAQLAQDAGLEVDSGIVVDGTLRTSDAAIWAIGDCAVYPDTRTGTRVRPESVQTATDQARAVVASITGNAEPYDAVPWFWTVQCGLKLQIAGLPRPGLEMVATGPLAEDEEARQGSLQGFEDGHLCLVESLQAPGDHLAARKLLAAGCDLTPAQARGEGFSLKAYAKARR